MRASIDEGDGDGKEDECTTGSMHQSFTFTFSQMLHYRMLCPSCCCHCYLLAAVVVVA